MRFFVIGNQGRMGKLRTKILQDLGHDVFGYNIDNGMIGFPNGMSIDGLLICTPPKTHAELISAHHNTAPLFIEKPVYNKPGPDRPWDHLGFVGCNTRWIVDPYRTNGIIIEYDHNYPGACNADLVHFEDLKNVFDCYVKYYVKFESPERKYSINDFPISQSVIDNSYILEMVEFVKFCQGKIPSPNPIGMANQTLRRVFSA